MVAKLCDRVAILRKGQLCEVIDLHVEENKATLEEKFLAYTAENVQAVAVKKGRKARKEAKKAQKAAKSAPVATEAVVAPIQESPAPKKDEIRIVSRRKANKAPNPPRFHMLRGDK